MRYDTYIHTCDMMTVKLQCPSPIAKLNRTVSNIFGCILKHSKRYKLQKDLRWYSNEKEM